MPRDDAWIERSVVDGIPTVIAFPRDARAPGELALWLPYLGGTKETFLGVLTDLAAQGFVAVSIDPRRHGDRRPAGLDLRQLVVDGFRSDVWPILGGTVLDAFEITECALHRFGLVRVVCGGVSLGGDIALALAGIDPRVLRVAAVAATPDWTRPGMTQVGRPDQVIDQGAPTAYGRSLHDALSPIAHTDRYREGLAIRFDVGTDDTHVPAEAAERFALDLRSRDEAATVDILRHPGDHLDVALNPQILAESAQFLVSARVRFPR